MIMSNNEVRQSIRDDWERLNFLPLDEFQDIESKKYLVTPEGRIVKGEYFGDKAGLPLKVYYDKQRKMKYSNIKNVYDNTVRLYCDDMALYHAYISKKFI